MGQLAQKNSLPNAEQYNNNTNNNNININVVPPPAPMAPTIDASPPAITSNLGAMLNATTLKKIDNNLNNTPRTGGAVKRTGSLFDQIKSGFKLKDAKDRKLADIKPENQNNFTWTPFNIDKIVARRAALEFSDDDDDDDWDESDDDW